MPWILQDYKSDHLDLSDPEVFRDLSKPIGAHGDPSRMTTWKERMEAEDDHKFLYASHYSCPGYVIGFHAR